MRRLEELLEVLEPEGADGTVDGAMVARQRHLHHAHLLVAGKG